MKSDRLATIWGLLILAARAVQGGSIAESLKDKFSKTATKHDAMVDLRSIMNTVLSHPNLQTQDESAKTNKMISLLHQLTSAAQAPLMKAINSLNVSATPLWISNDIFLKDASLSVLQSLANIPGDFIIREPVTVSIIPVSSPDPADQYSSGESRAGEEVQWGVSKIGAPAVWASKTRGEGIIVSNIDTGVNNNHESLKDNYAGQWYDPLSHTQSPMDDNGHGTHVMGITCGTTRGIGVAPGAKWIACKAFDDQGRARESNLKACGQWILEQKPHVINNSWGGRAGRNFYNDVVTAWKNAGIFSAFAIGNDGPDCNTTDSPGDQPVVFSVGSTRPNDTVSGFSSRGPTVKILGRQYTKPEVSAPGSSILSADYAQNNAYILFSGTSMATPHVAGAVALMKAAKPGITYDQIVAKLKCKAIRPSVSQRDVCDSITTRASFYPNNSYGNGRISVSGALGV